MTINERIKQFRALFGPQVEYKATSPEDKVFQSKGYKECPYKLEVPAQVWTMGRKKK